MMNEENTVLKKPRSILVFKILATVFLIPALVGACVAAESYAYCLLGRENAELGMVMVLVFCVILWALPCGILSLSFSILGLCKVKKYYAATESKVGRKAEFAWLISLLCVGAVICVFALYLIVLYI